MFRLAGALVVAGIFTVARPTPNHIVYMVESDTGKHIAIANADGTAQRLLTGDTDWHLYPDIDAPGTQVVYVAGPDAEHLGVVLKDLESGTVEPVTDRQGMHLHPKFSGDGRTLAWAAPVGPGGRHQIAVLDLARWRADRSTRPRVLASEHACFFPALSSDGHLVAFHRNLGGEKKDIRLVDVRDDSARTVTPADEVAMAPAFSCDDRWIAYARRKAGRWDIARTDWRKGGAVPVTDDDARDHAPTFRPDGGLIFASDRGGHFELWELTPGDLEGGTARPRPLVRGEASYYAPASTGMLRNFMKQGIEAPLPDPPRSSFGAVHHQGRIYIAGGHKGKEHTYPPESFMPDLEIYDVAARTWKRAAPRAVPCHGFQIVAHEGGIFAFGGFAYSKDHRPRWKSLDAIERYDIATDRWHTVGKLPRPRSSNVAGVVGGKVYLLGGWDSTPQREGDLEGRFHREIDVFDLKTRAVSVSPHPLPDPLRRAMSGLVLGNRILMVGGLGQGASHFELMDRVTAFDPVRGVFEEWSPLPFPTFAPAVGEVEGQLMVMGGMFRTGKLSYDYVNHIFRLEGPRGRWVHTGRYLRETKGFSQVLELAPGRLAVLGGHSYDVEGDDGPVSTFETLLVGP